MLKVAIQGTTASFHHEAAIRQFGEDVDILACDTFLDCFEALKNGTANRAIVAIENSLFGSINEVYDLLLKHSFWVSGEVYLRIKQNLIGLPDASLKNIIEVHSHPVALAQCHEYLDKHLPRAERFEHHDTAGSVEDVKKWGDKTKAAIASQSAAILHGLKVLKEEIETNKNNYTRFVVLQKHQLATQTNTNKTSLVLTTHGDTQPGALHRALAVFADNDISLSMLQSRPIVGKTWHYMFYIDALAGHTQAALINSLKALERNGCDVTILGSYQNGLK